MTDDQIKRIQEAKGALRAAQHLLASAMHHGTQIDVETLIEAAALAADRAAEIARGQ